MSVKQHLALAALFAMSLLPASAGRGASLGHPGVSTKPGPGQTKQWTLICDPQYVTDGRITTQYTTNATLSEVDPIFPYQLSKVTIELQTSGDSITYASYFPNSNGIVTIDPTTFGTSVQTGRAQVSWNIMSGQSLPTMSDDDTHLLRFTQTPGTSGTSATFTDKMIDYGTGQGVPAPDYYSGIITDPPDPVFTYTSQQFDPMTGQPNPDFATFTTETVTFDIGTPEPSSLSLLGVVCIGGLLRRRRKGV